MPSLSVHVLVDNSTLTDRFFTGEPGLSLYLETDSRKVLFDLGYSGAFIANARKMGIDLLNLDYVVLSHGHIDHTGGLPHLIQLHLEAKIEHLPHKVPKILVHPHCLYPRPFGRLFDIGSMIPYERLARYFPVEVSRAPVWIAGDLVFLGEIPREIAFPERPEVRKRMIALPNSTSEDRLLDDTALAYRSPEGIVILTGCSHSGIANIIETAKKVCGDDRILDVIGGLHLLDPSPGELAGTVGYLKKAGVRALHPCHCTSLAAKSALAQAVPVHEAGVGLRLDYGREGNQPLA
jgi:7,8-dihydropterin-6-yl-methyl-4-(beta-D-ribofuranosyl)aminobenzene 5'-phosphate synthase